MLKVLLASALCLLMLACVKADDFVEIEIIGQPSSQLVELDSNNSTSRSKRGCKFFIRFLIFVWKL
jgi:hypothetical protein